MRQAKRTAGKGPGKHWRSGLSLEEFFELFPDDEAAELFFMRARWPHGDVSCPRCGSDRVQEPGGKAPLRFRCRLCRRFFSVKSSSVMKGSPLGYRKWLLALFLMLTNLKGISSLKLHRDLKIRYPSAWHLAHRIREAWDTLADVPLSPGVTEVDETYVGGKEKNKHYDRKLPAKKRIWRGQGESGKSIVVGAKNRETNQIRLRTVTGAKKGMLVPFIRESVPRGSTVYTDKLKSYDKLGLEGYRHDSVNHKKKEFVRGKVHTNGIESGWAMLKRTYMGTYHRWSHKHENRYLAEIAGRHNLRQENTLVQLVLLARAMFEVRLRMKDLTAGG